MAFVHVDLAALATNPNYFTELPATNVSEPAISLLSYHPDFETLLGPDASARKIADYPWEAFHEAGIYNKKDNSLYVTSNYQNLQDNINITIVSLDDYSVITSTQFPDLASANGGTSYYPPDSDQADTPPQQIYCDQGSFETYSQLLAVDPNTNESYTLLNSFNGKNFSSINDARQHPVTGDIWFTDADYGWFQDFRPEPTQPKQVYRFTSKTGAVQVVADGFVEPNGLEFSPDLQTLYVSDTGSQQFEPVPTGPATIYAFDVVDSKRLANRRTFSFTEVGFPDGIHCDTQGNVWSSAGDGVYVWNPEGVLLGKIFVGEMSNNFAFAPGKVFVFSNARLWIVENVKAVGREVCKDFGTGDGTC